MKNRFLITSALSLFLAASFFACEKSGSTTTYQDVRPILATSCAVSLCHDSNTAPNNVEFTSYATMSGQANGRRNVLSKDANNFYDMVFVKGTMPKTGTMSQADKDLLQSWVDNNFAEN